MLKANEMHNFWRRKNRDEESVTTLSRGRNTLPRGREKKACEQESKRESQNKEEINETNTTKNRQKCAFRLTKTQSKSRSKRKEFEYTPKKRSLSA